jgi:hypothetical protein
VIKSISVMMAHINNHKHFARSCCASKFICIGCLAKLWVSAWGLDFFLFKFHSDSMLD